MHERNTSFSSSIHEGTNIHQDDYYLPNAANSIKLPFLTRGVRDQLRYFANRNCLTLQSLLSAYFL